MISLSAHRRHLLVIKAKNSCWTTKGLEFLNKIASQIELKLRLWREGWKSRKCMR